jgi:hypothetical protein
VASALVAAGFGIGAAAPVVAAPILVSDLVAGLTVAAENTSAYDRDFFQHWIDADGDGCDTRQEVLMAESTVATTPAGGCPVTSGRWESWYDGGVWTAPGDLDIDHMVPLSEAWDSGAWAWTPEQRRDFANDLGFAGSLAAVTDNINQSKGEKDPAQWLPPAGGAAMCRYIADWVAVKYRWALTIDTTEQATLISLLSSPCAGTTVEPPARAIVPQGTAAIEAYVTKVYNDLFNRNPDPSGLRTWTTALQQGTPYGEVANGITYSREFRTGLIRDSYQHYLGRGPDVGGLENWLTAMAAGMHIEQMQMGFIASDEFYLKAGSNDRQWVTNLYQMVLGRSPAVSEIDHWQRVLNAGAGRGDVARGFLYSTEHLTTVVDGYYVDLLRRHIDPSGQATWVSAIQGGARDEQIIASIVSSPEYRAKP